MNERFTCLINSNGDKRIDYDEWFTFFLKVLMGSPEQQMLIAFKFYDLDNHDFLTRRDVDIVLKHIVAAESSRYGISFDKGNPAKCSRYDLGQKKQKDNKEIRQFVDILF